MAGNFMTLGHAVEIVMDLAQQGALDDVTLVNDPQLAEEAERQQTAVDTVHDFFVNNVFDGTEEDE